MSIVDLKEREVLLASEFAGFSNKPSKLTKKCRSCNRHIDPSDILLGSCPYCLESKSKDCVEKFRPFDSTKQEFPRCYECQAEIYKVGMMAWDSLANTHKLVCIKCGQKQMKEDSQYSDTPWGYEKKLK